MLVAAAVVTVAGSVSGARSDDTAAAAGLLAAKREDRGSPGIEGRMKRPGHRPNDNRHCGRYDFRR